MNVGMSVSLTWVHLGGQASHLCLLPTDYSMHHIGQFFHSNYIFLFQLPWLPEKLLSMSDFQVQRSEGPRHGWGIAGWDWEGWALKP